MSLFQEAVNISLTTDLFSSLSTSIFALVNVVVVVIRRLTNKKAKRACCYHRDDTYSKKNDKERKEKKQKNTSLALKWFIHVDMYLQHS